MSSSPSRWRRGIVAGLLSSSLAACGGGNAASHLAQAPEYAPKDQTKCGVRKSQATPLIVEWPAAARAELESAAKHGLVAVRYEGCEMEVLSQCHVTGGAYSYTPTTRHRDRVTMRDEDDLYANVPIGAARLGAKLHSAGELNVKMTIVGMYQSDKGDVRADELVGDCNGATHIVAGLSAGAFEFFAGADSDLGGGAAVSAIGAGAGSAAKRETIEEAGEEAACEKSTADDKSPPYDCGALVRLEVVPLEPRRAAVAPIAEAPPAPKPENSAAVTPSDSATPIATAEPPPPDPPPPDPPPSTPPPASTDSNKALYIVIGGVILGGVIAAAVVANVVKKSSTAPVQRSAGLGSGTVGFAPVFRW